MYLNQYSKNIFMIQESTEQDVREMNLQRIIIPCLFAPFFCLLITGCAEKKPLNIHYENLAEFSDRLGQANVKLFRYSGEAEIENIKEYTEKLGCKMLYAYFYPDTIPLSEIPVEEINTAKTYTEAYEILYNNSGYTKWRYVAQCFSMIPITSDCYESPVSQNCR